MRWVIWGAELGLRAATCCLPCFLLSNLTEETRVLKHRTSRKIALYLIGTLIQDGFMYSISYCMWKLSLCLWKWFSCLGNVFKYCISMTNLKTKAIASLFSNLQKRFILWSAFIHLSLESRVKARSISSLLSGSCYWSENTGYNVWEDTYDTAALTLLTPCIRNLVIKAVQLMSFRARRIQEFHFKNGYCYLLLWLFKCMPYVHFNDQWLTPKNFKCTVDQTFSCWIYNTNQNKFCF